MENRFFERFSELCKAHGTTVNAVARIIGASSGSVTAWKRGAAPRNATLTKIADHFGVSTDYLLGLEEASDVLEEVDVAFYGQYRELTEADKQTIRDMVEVLHRRVKSGE